MRPGQGASSEPVHRVDVHRREGEKLKASVRAKVEHPFRVVKQQFGYAKVRYRGLAKNTARLTMLFALSNLWMAPRAAACAACRAKCSERQG
jgi:IS5 family transposase